MFAVLAVLGVLILTGLRIRHDDNYLSKDSCNAVKGVFIALVFICHSSGYLDDLGVKYTGLLEQAFLFFRNALGQSTVAMFMFYSGYGVMKSYRDKGGAYVRSMPRRRLLATLLNFDIAVVIFLSAGMLLGYRHDIWSVLKALVAWESIGNSNWYIFTIMLCYLLSFMSFSITSAICPAGRKDTFAVVILWSVLLAGMLTLNRIGQPSWWYDTMLVFGLGATWACHRDRFEQFLMRHWVPAIAIAAIACASARFLPPDGICGLCGNLYTGFFAALIVLFTMRLKIANPVLAWMGTRLFPIYIYQRLPMIAMIAICPEVVKDTPAIFVAISAAATAIIAASYKFIALRF